MEKLLVISTIIAIFLITQVSVLNLKVTNMQCFTFDKTTGEFTKCLIKAVNRDVSEVSIYYKLGVKSINNASLKMRLSMRGTYKYNVLYQYKINICEFFRNNRRNPLAEIFYGVTGLQKYSNMNHTCPYEHDLIIDRCQFDTKPLNLLAIKKGEYKIFTTWYVEEKPVAEIDLSLLMY